MSANEKCVLAIDLGTGGPKTAVFNQSGEMLGSGEARVETRFLPGGGAEQDPEEVWAAVKATCVEALRKANVSPDDLVGLQCGSQYSSIVPVDTEGNATGNMIVWMDHRGAPKELAKITGQDKKLSHPLMLFEYVRIHGIPPVPSGADSLAHIKWIKYARPEIYEKTYKFLEPMDFIAMKFTGRATANQCTALMSLVTDNRTLNTTRYNDELLKYSGIDVEKLPELQPIEAPVGPLRREVAEELGLSPDTMVVSSTNDTHTGGLVCSAFTGDHCGLSIGTTGVMITHVDFKRTDIKTSILSVPSPVPDTYFVMAENGVAGRALEYFLEDLIFASDTLGDHSEEEKFEILHRAVMEVGPGANGVLFLPWMDGASAPAEDANMRGGFLNISLKTTRPHLARAVLEGVAMNLRWLRESIEKFAKRDFTHVMFYGGGARSDAWSQIIADVGGCPVHQIANPRYANSLGGALLAFQRLGMLSFDDFSRLVEVRRVYDPDPRYRTMYDDLYRQFRAAYKKNRSIFRGLNRIRFSDTSG